MKTVRNSIMILFGDCIHNMCKNFDFNFIYNLKSQLFDDREMQSDSDGSDDSLNMVDEIKIWVLEKCDYKLRKSK